MNRVYGCEDAVELWEEKAKEGLLRNDSNISSLLSDMSITGLANSSEDEEELCEIHPMMSLSMVYRNA